MSEVIATFSNYDGMVQAFRTIKDKVGLSNGFCENIADLAPGHIDKVLGPTRVKNIGPFVFDVLTELLAVEFEMKINTDALKRMQPRWEKRDVRKIRVDAHVISKALITRAKPAIYKEVGAQLAEARKKIKPSVRRRIAKHAAKARWSKPQLVEIKTAARSKNKIP